MGRCVRLATALRCLVALALGLAAVGPPGGLSAPPSARSTSVLTRSQNATDRLAAAEDFGRSSRCSSRPCASPPHPATRRSSSFHARVGAGLRGREDLRAKTIAVVGPDSTSGYVCPMMLLIQGGLAMVTVVGPISTRGRERLV